MAHILEGVRAKIERAEEHIENLNSEISEFLRVNPNPYQIVGKLEPDGLSYVFTAYGELSVPPRFSIIAGEAIHHLRSGFDHLIRALIVHNGETPTNANQFPIRTTPEKFEKACEGGAIEGVSRSARNLIKSVQPYSTSNAATSTLKFIHDLDNIDKHQLLNVICVCVGLPEVSEMTLGTAPRTGPKIGKNIYFSNVVPYPPVPVTNDGTKILCINLSKPEPDFNANAKLSPQIMLDVSGEYMPAINVLTKMLKYTIRTIDSFGGEF